ncbi:alcohol dehydrogenase catalytic domain-containing protein [Actinomadura meridiana]|uniref:alcohol dehydrogenase catalytic domain-containing protein n=1 Tax=Actinomadura meridiana TaxID=559626 RepID=UPI0031EB084E
MAIDSRIPVGEPPPPGTLPSRMFAQVVRPDRFGDPMDALQIEEVPVPEPGPGEVLVAVMAAGINFNNVWAARGVPIDVIAERRRKGEPWDFHVGGSDASGVVHAVGDGVRTVAVGDRVVVHPGHWDPDDPQVKCGSARSATWTATTSRTGASHRTGTTPPDTARG